MDSVTFVGSWVTFVFSILLLVVVGIFFAKNGWLLGNKMSSTIAGMIYSLGTGTLFGLILVSIFLSHFEIN